MKAEAGTRRTDGLRRCWRLAAVVAVALFAGCEWLLNLDTVAPECRLVSPADSAAVSGVVSVRAEATDSVGVSRIDFYADGAYAATESTATALFDWDARSMPDQSWHRLHCVAYDLAGNAGYSETASVKVAKAEQKNVFHGVIDLGNGTYFSQGFKAESGDTLAASARAQTSGVISSFLWLTPTEFLAFRQQQSYSPLLRQTDVREFSVRGAVLATDSFYVVFTNTTGFPQSYWARITVE